MYFQSRNQIMLKRGIKLQNSAWVATWHSKFRLIKSKHLSCEVIYLTGTFIKKLKKRIKYEKISKLEIVRKKGQNWPRARFRIMPPSFIFCVSRWIVGPWLCCSLVDGHLWISPFHHNFYIEIETSFDSEHKVLQHGKYTNI